MLQLIVWLGHSCPRPLTLPLKLLLPLQLVLIVWLGHSCPRPLTLPLTLIF